MVLPLTYARFRQKWLGGETTCQQEVEQILANIVAQKDLNIFLEVFEQEALEKAKYWDEQRASGATLPACAGMVVAIKDNILYEGHKSSASSKMLEGYRALYTATCLERLIEAGAIVVGRTNCDEFAMGSSNENSAFGPVGNPLDASKVSGGSSGGSAAAVGAGMCHIALGTDTGGSIRQPASFCGVIGMRPSYGRISRYGLVAFASSMDQVGPMGNDIHDVAMATRVMSGDDGQDATVAQWEVAPATNPIEQLHQSGKVLFIKEGMHHPGLAPAVAEGVRAVYDKVEKMGWEASEVEFPYLDHMVPTYAVLAMAEASSNLGRYSGMTYGYRSAEAGNVEEVIVKSRTEGFGAEVKRRIMLGTYVLSEGYYDAYYTKAQKVRRIIKDYSDALFEQGQYIITPSAPTAAFAMGEKSADPIAMYLADIFCIHAALAGLPAISLPLWKDEAGMPIGIQVMGKVGDEEGLFSFAKGLIDIFA